MSIVVALLGAFDCGVTFALTEGFVWDIAFGAAFVACGLVLMVLFGRVARRAASSENSRLSSFGTAVLAVGTLTVLLGAGGAATDLMDPFSWMMATVGFAIFVDALCLKINLSNRG